MNATEKRRAVGMINDWAQSQMDKIDATRRSLTIRVWSGSLELDQITERISA